MGLPQAGLFCPAPPRSAPHQRARHFQAALDAAAIAALRHVIARRILERNNGAANIVWCVCTAGPRCRTAGRAMAEGGKRAVPVGTLDISSYRDDGRGAPQSAPARPRRWFHTRSRPGGAGGRRALHRTHRARGARRTGQANVGHPESVQLAVLVDRGERELPTRRERCVGRNIEAPPDQRVYVRLAEVDGVDEVVIGGAEKGAPG